MLISFAWKEDHGRTERIGKERREHCALLAYSSPSVHSIHESQIMNDESRSESSSPIRPAGTQYELLLPRPPLRFLFVIFMAGRRFYSDPARCSGGPSADATPRVRIPVPLSLPSHGGPVLHLSLSLWSTVHLISRFHPSMCGFHLDRLISSPHSAFRATD